MNNQVPAERTERIRQRSTEIAQAIAARPELSPQARLDRLVALLGKQRLAAWATAGGRITDERWEADANTQLRVMQMVSELMDEFPAKTMKVDATVRAETLVALLQALPPEQRDQLAVMEMPAIAEGEPAEPDDA